MARIAKREEPGPRYHPSPFGRTSEGRGELSSSEGNETPLANALCS